MTMKGRSPRCKAFSCDIDIIIAIYGNAFDSIIITQSIEGVPQEPAAAAALHNKDVSTAAMSVERRSPG